MAGAALTPNGRKCAIFFFCMILVVDYLGHGENQATTLRRKTKQPPSAGKLTNHPQKENQETITLRRKMKQTPSEGKSSNHHPQTENQATTLRRKIKQTPPSEGKSSHHPQKDNQGQSSNHPLRRQKNGFTSAAAYVHY